MAVVIEELDVQVHHALTIFLAWLVFIVVDFTVGPLGPVDPHWLYLAGAVGIGAHLLRRGSSRP